MGKAVQKLLLRHPPGIHHLGQHHGQHHLAAAKNQGPHAVEGLEEFQFLLLEEEPRRNQSDQQAEKDGQQRRPGQGRYA